MKVRYQIFKRLNLEVHQFIGDWSTPVFETFLKRLVAEPDFIFVDKVIVDLRKANLKPAVQELDRIVNFRNNINQKKLEVVHIVDSPTGTAVTHLYQEILNLNGFNYEYCSTVEYALKILDLDITENEMDDLLKNFLTNQIELKSDHENQSNPVVSVVQH